MSPTPEIPRGLRLVIIWLLIGTAVFLAVLALQSQAQRSRFTMDTNAGAIELRRAPDGHFHWPGKVNGVAVEFLVDTGATSTAIPRQLADRLQLASDGSVQSSTAGGRVLGSLVRADLELQGGPRIERLRMTVLPQLDAPLLGMDVLSKMRFTQSAGVLRLEAAR